VVDTVTRRQIDPECFDRFFAAMALDLTVTAWPTWPDLRDGYMEGSAAVIGEMMLPVLEPLTDEATAPARSLGLAFQLTNFLRDVGEDLDRGRVYLPADDLARHGADVWSRQVTPAWRSFLAEQIARNRELYRLAAPGIAMLPPASARCVATAHTLYARILDRIEAADYDVFSGRVRVPTWRKALTAGGIVVADGARRRTRAPWPTAR
jgi:15-cis-phytoene synthase